MTVDDLLRALAGAYPAFNAKALEAFGPTFRKLCTPHEGPALRDAWLAVSGEFVPGGKAGLFPVPAQFEPHLPGKKLQLPSAGPVLNFKQHAEAYHRLMTDWECGQCARAAAGIPEVKRALSFVAAQVANAEAWKPNPAPILLTRRQVREAQQRAISGERLRVYGAPASLAGPKTNDDWWHQIQAIAERWGIATNRGEWGSEQASQKPEAA
jgi:hypothetical protein